MEKIQKIKSVKLKVENDFAKNEDFINGELVGYIDDVFNKDKKVFEKQIVYSSIRATNSQKSTTISSVASCVLED